VRRSSKRIEIYKGDDGDWYFRRVAGNSRIVSGSEGYRNFGDCEGEARKLYEGVPVFVRSSDGTWSEWAEV